MNVTAAAWRELQTLLGIFLLALLIYWLFRARRRSPGAFGLLVLSILAYLPVSGIFSLNATVAEHWIYLSARFFLAAAIQSAEFFAQPKSDNSDCGHRSVCSLASFFGSADIPSHFRLERSAHVCRANDCERRQFGADVD